MRSSMEWLLSTDFSHVRTHTGSRAAESADSVHALAYTVGHEIVFGAGQFAPDTSAGRRLLAHELTHVVQQSSGTGSVSADAEGEAEAVGGQAAAGSRGSVKRGAPVSLQRQEKGAAGETVGYAIAGSIAEGGVPLKKSVESTHWNSEAEKQTFIRNYIRYSKDHGLTKQYQDAVAAYPAFDSATPPSVAGYFSTPPAAPPANQAVQQPQSHSTSTTPHAGGAQWKLGPRGEHLPTENWKGGPLRPLAEYDKPWAMDLARQGNYEAAELAQNYLCASCHILTKVHPRDFNLNGYVNDWQANYIRAFVEIPLMANPIGGAWEIGVSAGQAYTGKGSGLHIHNISSVIVYGRSDLGQTLSTRQRVFEGGAAVIGIATMALGARAGAAVPEEITLVEGPRLPPSAATDVAIDPVDVPPANRGGGPPGTTPGEGGGGGAPAADAAKVKASGRLTPGTRGDRVRSAQALGDREAAAAPGAPLPAAQQQMAQSLLEEHPGLNAAVANDSVKGAASVAGKGVKGADVRLINGGGREVSVHTGAFSDNSVGSHLLEEAAQKGTTEIYLQINSGAATREGLLNFIPAIRNGYVDLRGVFVKFFGPDGAVWWSGRFGGPR